MIQFLLHHTSRDKSNRKQASKIIIKTGGSECTSIMLINSQHMISDSQGLYALDSVSIVL